MPTPASHATTPVTWLSLAPFQGSLQEAFSAFPSSGTCFSGQFCSDLLGSPSLNPLWAPSSAFSMLGQEGSVFWPVCFKKSILIIDSSHLQSGVASTESHSGGQVSIHVQALRDLAPILFSSAIFPDTSSAQSRRPSSSEPSYVRFLRFHEHNPAGPWGLSLLGRPPPSPQHSATLFCALRALCASPLCQSCDLASVCAIISIMPLSFTRL